MSDTLIFPGSTVKMTKNGHVAGYLVRFSPPDGTEKDLDGEYFTAATNLGSYASKGHEIEVYIDHGQDPAFGVKSVGTGTVTMTDAGAWFEAQLELAEEYEAYVRQLIEAGKLGWSSGAATHLVRKSGPQITNWPVIEASLTATPAEPRNLAQSIKAAKLRPLSEYVSSTEAGEPAVVADTPTEPAEPVALPIPETKAAEPAIEEPKMPDETKTPDGLDALSAKFDLLLEALKPKEEVKAIKPEPPQERPTFEAPAVAEFSDIWKYDNYDSSDLDGAIVMMDAMKRASSTSTRPKPAPSPALVAAFAIRAQDEYTTGDRATKSRLAPTVRAMKAARLPGSQKGLMDAMKANELHHTTGTGAIDEWVGTAYSSTLWELIRYGSPILGMVPVLEVPQNAESYTLGTQTDSVTWYKTAEATAATNPGATTATVTSSKLASAQKVFTLGKLSAMGRYSQEVTEDAFIPFVAQLRSDMALTGSETLEHVVIDGDTATGATTNINDIGGTPAGTEAFLIANGFRKSCIVTTTANSRDGGTITIEDFLETVKLMGLGGREGFDRTKVAFILPIPTHYKVLELAQVLTKDVYSQPTLENGVLTNIFGYNVYVSANMHRHNQDTTYALKANSAGKIDLDTASNNTTGSILAVRWDQWKLARKGQMRFAADYDIDSDSFKLAAHMRAGVGQRTTEASAISYNLTL